MGALLGNVLRKYDNMKRLEHLHYTNYCEFYRLRRGRSIDNFNHNIDRILFFGFINNLCDKDGKWHPETHNKIVRIFGYILCLLCLEKAGRKGANDD